MSAEEQVSEEVQTLSLPTSIADTDTDTLSSGISPRRRTVAKTHYDAHKYDSGANIADGTGAASYVAVILGTEHIMPEKGKPFTVCMLSLSLSLSPSLPCLHPEYLWGLVVHRC